MISRNHPLIGEFTVETWITLLWMFPDHLHSHTLPFLPPAFDCKWTLSKPDKKKKEAEGWMDAFFFSWQKKLSKLIKVKGKNGKLPSHIFLVKKKNMSKPPAGYTNLSLHAHLKAFAFELGWICIFSACGGCKSAAKCPKGGGLYVWL